MEYDRLEINMHIELTNKKTGIIKKGKIINIYGDDIIKVYNRRNEYYIYTNEYIIKQYIPKTISKDERLRIELKKLLNNNFVIKN